MRLEFSSESYRKDVLIPVLRVLIRNPEGREIYENVVDFKQPILLPADVSEYECKTKQVRKLKTTRWSRNHSN